MSALLSTLFPATCILCGAAGVGDRDLCAGCAVELPHNHHACGRCAHPFATAELADTLCEHCQRQPPPFHRSLSAFRYAGAVPFLIIGAKFNGQLTFIRLLGQCLAERVIAAAQPLPEVLIPVPLHPQRLRERGYNQSLEIARVVGRELQIPVDYQSCARVLATTPQTELSAQARLHNVRGAFALTRPPQWSRVALIDDVMTTATTVSELSRVLARAGVAEIAVWTVARAGQQLSESR
ncbi:phosphoribosyltransferase [Chromatium okenii]|uniref:ComF family protein n=1 Tax=Chromatium okenii TaxID=61644 RepID=UPI001904A55B|nr:ComF family protein [Chromatium okenii]MBK1641243.1 phosphoribosyltransferase [Chromatium okenii]